MSAANKNVVPNGRPIPISVGDFLQIEEVFGVGDGKRS